MKLTRLQRNTLELMIEADRPLIEFVADGRPDDYYCGQSAGNHVHAWTARGLIQRGLVSADPQRSDPQHYWVNEKGRLAYANSERVEA